MGLYLNNIIFFLAILTPPKKVLKSGKMAKFCQNIHFLFFFCGLYGVKKIPKVPKNAKMAKLCQYSIFFVFLGGIGGQKKSKKYQKVPKWPNFAKIVIFWGV